MQLKRCEIRDEGTTVGPTLRAAANALRRDEILRDLLRNAALATLEVGVDRSIGRSTTARRARDASVPPGDESLTPGVRDARARQRYHPARAPDAMPPIVVTIADGAMNSDVVIKVNFGACFFPARALPMRVLCP